MFCILCGALSGKETEEGGRRWEMKSTWKLLNDTEKINLSDSLTASKSPKKVLWRELAYHSCIYAVKQDILYLDKGRCYSVRRDVCKNPLASWASGFGFGYPSESAHCIFHLFLYALWGPLLVPMENLKAAALSCCVTVTSKRPSCLPRPW